MGGLLGRVPRCWRGLTLRQLQQQSIYAQEGWCWCSTVPQQGRRRNWELQPETGHRSDRECFKTPGAFLPPFLLWDTGPDDEGILPAPPTATPAPLSLPQWGKNPTPLPSASTGVRSASSNIRGAKALTRHRSLSPLLLHKLPRPALLQPPKALWAVSLPALLLAPPSFPAALWTSWHCNTSPFPRSGDAAEQSPTLPERPQAQKCSWQSLLNQIPPEDRFHAV